jgi:hypothetical protein
VLELGKADKYEQALEKLILEVSCTRLLAETSSGELTQIGPPHAHVPDPHSRAPT